VQLKRGYLRRFPAPWTVETIPGGFKVVDATGVTLAHVYADNRQIVNSLTTDEARRIAVNIAKLPTLLSDIGN
jgi:hypothetical protein